MMSDMRGMMDMMMTGRTYGADEGVAIGLSQYVVPGGEGLAKGIALAPAGSLYLADTESHTIRRIDLKSGIITTVAGTGQRGDGPDGNPLQCRLARPHGIFVSADGTVYIGDSESHRIRTLR